MEVLSDTRPESEAVLLDLLSKKTTAERLRIVDQLNMSVMSLAISGLRTRHGNIDGNQLHRHLADLLLGEEVAFKVYGSTRHPTTSIINEHAIDATLTVIALLDQLSVPYLIGGSLASAVYGNLRTTPDADLLADIRTEHIESFASALEKDFYLSTDAIRDAITHRSSFNVIHFGSAFKVDIFLPKNRAFDERQFENRILQSVATNPVKKAYIASADDTILAKLDWYSQGNETFERQWLDILGIIKAPKANLNISYMRQQAGELNVSDLLERALKHLTR